MGRQVLLDAVAVIFCLNFGIIAIELATVIGVSAAGCGKKVSAEKADNKSEKEVTITAATGG